MPNYERLNIIKNEWGQRYSCDYPVPKKWKGPVHLEIGPGNGFYQHFRALSATKGERLNDTALILIDPQNRLYSNTEAALQEKFGHVSILMGDGFEIIQHINQDSVQRIDINNVFGLNLMKDYQLFALAVNRILEKKGELIIRETYTPTHQVRNKLLDTLSSYLSITEITDPQDPIFVPFNSTMEKEESYAIICVKNFTSEAKNKIRRINI